MDLTQFDTKSVANTGVPMPVHLPDGSPLLKPDKSPVTITLLGHDSDLLTKVRNSQTNASLRGAPITAEIARTNEINLFAKATVAWDGIGIGEEETEFSEENARRLYREFPWIRDQVRTFIYDRSRFMKASQTS